jgi:hypothetical protein
MTIVLPCNIDRGAGAAQKQHQMDEDALPLMQKVTEWKRMQETCCPFTDCGLTIGSILAKRARIGARTPESNCRAANNIHPRLFQSNHASDGRK